MGKKDSNHPVQHLKVPVAAPNMRIGLLGGSFNPAHAAHRQISLVALKRLRLDQVWWLVSPSNPLKAKTKTASSRNGTTAINSTEAVPLSRWPALLAVSAELALPARPALPVLFVLPPAPP